MTMTRLLILRAARPAASSPRLHRAAPLPSAASMLPTMRFASASSDDGQVKVGQVQWYNAREGQGFIVLHGASKTKRDPAERAYINREDIKRPDASVYPVLRTGQRVQFRTAPPKEGTRSVRARELTLEGGALVPPFTAGFLEKYMTIEKSRFGAQVFEIYRHAKDQEELEKLIVARFHEVRDRIENKRARIEEVEALYARERERERERTPGAA